MVKLKKYVLLIVGIVLILSSAFLLADANSKQAKCESISGQIVQFLDSAKEQSCSQVKTMQFLSYAGLAIGVSLIVAHFVRGKK
jgi:uncharacterized protein (UPF0333 family)